MNKVILIGGFNETIELCELCGYDILGIVDIENRGWSYPYLGTDDELLLHAREFNSFPVVLTPDQPEVRMHLAQRYKAAGFHFASLISPKAFISPSAQIGDGCIIQSFCNISSNTILKECVRVNTYANVMHDNVLENYVTIAPNAVLLGLCHVEECGYIGANSTLLPCTQIGAGSTVGAGAVVTKNIPANTVVAGVPAKDTFRNKAKRMLLS